LFASLHLSAAVILRKTRQITFFHLQVALLAIAGAAHSSLVSALLFCAATMLILFDIISNSHDMAYRDELTALPSRRALNQVLLSLGRKYTIAMLDIDHFKKFNDTHGHDIGDEVLRMVAAKISAISGGGKPFRYGGEEFTIVFAGKTPDQSEAHLNALRQTIEHYSMVVREKRKKNDKEGKSKRGKAKTQQKTLSVTISIGLAARTKNQRKPEEVIKAADLALYRAKRNGRNCVSR
jgi:diguanylate cyclase (GGDEF)-like protein